MDPCRQRPQHVGILALELYVPPLKVLQADLEAHDGVPGKYTIGYGQSALAVCSAREDATSMALTALAHLLRKCGVLPERVGRLDVGSESGHDGAKSIKSSLMVLFDDSSDVEGGDHKGACYAGTAALLSAVDWVSGEGWDGRFAAVVLTDVALYAEPAARATGGAGAVAILVGPDAPLPLHRATVASHCQNVYDWFKPCGPLPQVNGKMSVSAYLDSLRTCCQRFCKKARAQLSGDIDSIDFACLHHPYNKLVQKGAEQLAHLLPALLTAPGADADHAAETISQFDDVEPKAKRMKGTFYDDRVACSTRLGRECGNMFTASLYACLASVIAAHGEPDPHPYGWNVPLAHLPHVERFQSQILRVAADSLPGSELEGKSVLMYSFGSGSMSSCFLIKARAPKDDRWSLSSIATRVCA